MNLYTNPVFVYRCFLKTIFRKEIFYTYLCKQEVTNYCHTSAVKNIMITKKFIDLTVKIFISKYWYIEKVLYASW